MKKFLKGSLQAVWRGTRPLRRPLVGKIDSYFDRRLAAIERLLASGQQRDDETSMVLNYVVRELIHVQRQVDTLQQSIDDLAKPAQATAVTRQTDGNALLPRSGGAP